MYGAWQIMCFAPVLRAQQHTQQQERELYTYIHITKQTNTHTYIYIERRFIRIESHISFTHSLNYWLLMFSYKCILKIFRSSRMLLSTKLAKHTISKHKKKKKKQHNINNNKNLKNYNRMCIRRD